MPADMQKLMQNKEAIINAISSRGPSLPIQIARETNLSLLFASAYLSELYNEQKVKMSNMKVGSSPLYYLSGQEAKLENFIQYLNQREKDAFSLLKSQKLLDDEKMEPAIRVALRAIKDFAIPIRVKSSEESKLLWKHFLVPDEEMRDIAQGLISPKKEKKKEEDKDKEKQDTLVKAPIPATNVLAEQEIKLEKPKVEKKRDERKEEVIEQLKQKIESLAQELKKPDKIEEAPKKEKKKKPIEESKFVRNIKDYLTSKDIELLSILEEKKKDLLARIRIDTIFGKQEYLLIAKEKKKVTEEDITIALHKAQLEKMPALFIAPGEIDKKAAEHAKTWKNLVKFEKVKF